MRRDMPRTGESMLRTRRVAAALAFALALGVAPAAHVRAAQEAVRPGHEVYRLTANRVLYYSDAATIQARGNVHFALPDGTTIDGDAFSMDLSLQRFLVVGRVRLRTSAGEMRGAAFADFLQFRRMYFVPLDPTADRWTFLAGDYSHPEKGRIMPGDAFFLADFSKQHPYIVAREAAIDPAAYVKFEPASFIFLGGAIKTQPLPPFVYNFSENPNFGVNALSGATFDAPYNFAGSASSLETLHLRYDRAHQTHEYLSFEHHSLFGDRGYLVFSLNPATQINKQWNAYGYFPAGARSALGLESQLFTYQHGLDKPLAASNFTDLQFTHALRQSSLRAEVTAVYDTLLAVGDCRLAPPIVLGCAPPNHPTIAALEWTGFDQHLARTGLTYRLQSGIGRVHDIYGVGTDYVLGNPQDVHPIDVTTAYLGGSLYTPVYRGPLGTGVNALLGAQRDWLSYPNVVDSQTLQLSASKRLSDKLYLVGSYLITAAATKYPTRTIASPNISAGLAAQPASPNGLPLVGGVVMTLPSVANHAEIVTLSYAPSTSFQFTLTGIHNRYYPVQIPGAGPPAYQMSAEVRARITRTLFIDVSRAYFFNWANQTWSPQFGIQITPQ